MRPTRTTSSSTPHADGRTRTCTSRLRKPVHILRASSAESTRGGDRTPSLRFRRPTLFRLSYAGITDRRRTTDERSATRPGGLEPPHPGLELRCRSASALDAERVAGWSRTCTTLVCSQRPLLRGQRRGSWYAIPRAGSENRTRIGGLEARSLANRPCPRRSPRPGSNRQHPPYRGGVLPPRTPGARWTRSGSNRRPPACKASALPTELLARDGLGGNRTRDLPIANRTLSRLSYEPEDRPSGTRTRGPELVVLVLFRLSYRTE